MRYEWAYRPSILFLSSGGKTVELRDHLRVLRRQWLLIVICVLVGTGAAALVVFRTTPQYASTVRLFVSTPT